jgi:hypothetical protein
MKRISFWLLVISFTFLIGVAATLLYLKFTHPAVQTSQTTTEFSSPNLTSMTWCELANNPEKHDGRTVRLNAKLSIGLEGSWFSDPNCGVNNAAVITAENKEVWQTIEQARKQKNKKPLSNEVDLVVIGKFKNTVYKDCCLITPFQFEILKVEKTSKQID